MATSHNQHVVDKLYKGSGTHRENYLMVHTSPCKSVEFHHSLSDIDKCLIILNHLVIFCSSRISSTIMEQFLRMSPILLFSPSICFTCCSIMLFFNKGSLIVSNLVCSILRILSVLSYISERNHVIRWTI